MALSPAPIRIAISGVATAEESFRSSLATACAATIQKRVVGAHLGEIQAAREETPDLRSLVQDSVGHVSLREFQRKLRLVSSSRALGLAKGNRSGAARLLRVSRQRCSKVVRRPPV